ncbi:hypothetical protein J6590_010749 [Homalodisca vitripennis]|nr:hypothetical protein J6590_010749 [Homalodisca vitripennis]
MVIAPEGTTSRLARTHSHTHKRSGLKVGAALHLLLGNGDCFGGNGIGGGEGVEEGWLAIVVIAGRDGGDFDTNRGSRTFVQCLGMVWGLATHLGALYICM